MCFALQTCPSEHMVQKQPLLQLELLPNTSPCPGGGQLLSLLQPHPYPPLCPSLTSSAHSSTVPSALTFTVSVKTLFADAASSSLWLGASGCTWSLQAASSTHLPARMRDSAAGHISSSNTLSLDSSANLEQKPWAQLLAIP